MEEVDLLHKSAHSGNNKHHHAGYGKALPVSTYFTGKYWRASDVSHMGRDDAAFLLCSAQEITTAQTPSGPFRKPCA